MGFFDKVKSMFIEEIEDEEEIKKEHIQVKIPSTVEQEIEEKKPEKQRKSKAKYEAVEVEPTLEDEVDTLLDDLKDINSVVEEKSTAAVPTFFDDSDFEMIEKLELEPTLVKKEYKYTRTETTLKPNAPAYGAKKEGAFVKKAFTPTPIISPVYGVLDKNYRKDEITTKKKEEPRRQKLEDTIHDNKTVDEIRRKAYGTLEDELENTLLEEMEEVIQPSIEAAKLDNTIDIFEELDDEKELINEAKIEIEEDSLIEDELNKNYDEYEEELNKSYSEDLNDSDLFNLIDSMYEKKDEE